MKKEYSFTEATPLIQFLENIKDKLIGKKIMHYYRDTCTGGGESPAVFVIGDMAIIVYYYWYSWMSVKIVDKESFYADTSLQFLYEDIPESRNVWYTEYCYDKEVAFVGKRIERIIVERFFEEHETSPALGGIRPNGGDYFKTITVQMSNGKAFYICGEEALCDGYMDIWE